MTLVIVDYNRTIYDPYTNVLMDGALEMLQGLKQKGCTLVLVSRGADREARLRELGLTELFAERLNVWDKTPELFKEIMARHPAEKTYVIGDHPYQEIRAGNLAGAFTIQFDQGVFADYAPESEADTPRVKIKKLEEALDRIA